MTQVARAKWLYCPLLSLFIALGGCASGGGDGESEGLGESDIPPGVQTEEGLAPDETLPPFRLASRTPLYRLHLVRLGDVLELRALARVETEVAWPVWSWGWFSKMLPA
jgi:hypothetical protein